MILGHGDIATALREGGVDRDDLLFFAAGVSNSRETRESEYKREIDLLLAQDRKARLVYFSSLCVFYSDSRYADHKFVVERRIMAKFSHYTILRMGNITWGNNPHTLINVLRERERLGLQQDIRDVYRYLVDKDEFLHWIRLIPAWNCEMNITGRRMKVREIYEQYVLPEGLIYERA